MPRIVTVPLSLEQREQLILLTKHAVHWRERQRAQTILWLSEGKTVAEVARLQERIPETIAKFLIIYHNRSYGILNRF